MTIYFILSCLSAIRKDKIEKTLKKGLKYDKVNTN